MYLKFRHQLVTNKKADAGSTGFVNLMKRG